MKTQTTETTLVRPTPHSAPPVETIDEAFASVTVDDLRLDVAHAARDESPAASSEQMTSVLRTQLAALEAQRRELARLLDSLPG